MCASRGTSSVARPRSDPMAIRLIGIGLVAGVFSSLFGVGGGIVIVPLLIGLLAFDAHSATATSLGAILITALAGVALYAARGELRPDTRRSWASRRLAAPSSAPASSIDSRADVDARFRGAPGCGRHLAGRDVSTWTIVLALVLGFATGILVRPVRRWWGHPLRPDPAGARSRPGRGRRNLAPRDRSDSRGAGPCASTRGGR